MIQANELRIGNKVKSVTHNLLMATVESILPRPRIITFEEISTYDTLDRIEPIPLSPEILQACDFEKDVLGWISKTHERLSLYQFQNGPIKTAWKEIIFGRQVKSLHQLQNLFYAITGIELNVNTKVKA